jgi:heptosyltransferase II
MNSESPSERANSVGRKRVAQILLRPMLWRYRTIVSLVDMCLRPLALLFGPDRQASTGPVENILIFDPGVLGDMMMLAPFLRNLRGYFPGSRMTLVGRPGAGALLLERGMVDEWIQVPIPWGLRASLWKRNSPFSLSWLNFFRDLLRLRKRRFDLGFATGWCADIRGNLAVWLAGARRRIGYDYGGGEIFLTDVVQPDLARPHIVDRNLQLLEHLGISEISDGDALPGSSEDAESAAELLTQCGVTKEDLVVGVHPGAGSAVREWGDERFAEVARVAAEKFGAKILWFNDPAKPRPVPASLDAISLTLPFRRFVAVLCRCHLFLCNDSGPMHVAVALKVPVVAVFGPQRPEWFGPIGEGHRVVIRHDIWCRPCGDQCRWEEPYCLSLIPVEQVMHEVEDVLKNVPTRTIRAAV